MDWALQVDSTSLSEWDKIMSTWLQGRFMLDIRKEVSNELDSVEKFWSHCYWWSSGRGWRDMTGMAQAQLILPWGTHTGELRSPGLILCWCTMGGHHRNSLSSLLLVLSWKGNGMGRWEVQSRDGSSLGLDNGSVRNCHGNSHSLCPSFSIAFVF